MKIFIITSFFLFNLLFSADFDMKAYQTSLINVKNYSAQIKDSQYIVVGSSGIVIHKFSDDSLSIIARVVVTEKKDGLAKVRFDAFESLKQPALPTLKIPPTNGDEVILNYLYDRSLIVAPNKKIYDDLVETFGNITFIHPDIVGAYLSYNYKPNPSRDDFRKMCNINAAGMILIALDKEIFFVDCGSFKILKSFKGEQADHYELPFYTRVKRIDTIFWKFSGHHIKDYNNYYKSLMEK